MDHSDANELGWLALLDPSTFEGAVIVTVVGGLLLVVIVGAGRWLWRRSRTANENSSNEVIKLDPPQTETDGADRVGGTGPPPDPNVADLATGIGQALMGVSAAIRHIERYGVLLEPDTFSLNESSAELLGEARRRVDEAEARLPRVRLVMRQDVAARAIGAVEELRHALDHLTDYIQQPGEGQDWSYESLEAAKASLESAQKHQDSFLFRAKTRPVDD